MTMELTTQKQKAQTQMIPTNGSRGAEVAVVAKDLAALVTKFSPHALAQLEAIPRAFALAEGVQRIRAAVRSVAEVAILPLAGSSLGFRTDKDGSGGYSVEVVAECATEALLRGLALVGNQWNIIGGRCYTTKEGMQALVAGIPGLTDLVVVPGIPKMGSGGAVVPVSASWNLHGRPMHIDREVPVRMNQGQIVDAVLGKAKRKALAAIYEMLTGSQISEGEVGEGGDELAQAPGATLRGSAAIKARAMTSVAAERGDDLPAELGGTGGAAPLTDAEKRAIEDDERRGR